MLQKAWTINKYWVNSENTITVVDFALVFTHEDFPGVQSLHGGIIPVFGSGLQAGADEHLIIAALLATIGDEIYGLEGFHHNQLAFEYDFKTGTEVQVRPVDLTAYAANKRWETETGGISVYGLTVATDDRSKLMLSGARIKADSDPSFTTRWKRDDGEFITLDAPTIVALSNAVLEHVSYCFEIEEQVVTGILNGTITTAAQINTAFAV